MLRYGLTGLIIDDTRGRLGKCLRVLRDARIDDGRSLISLTGKALERRGYEIDPEPVGNERECIRDSRTDCRDCLNRFRAEPCEWRGNDFRERGQSIERESLSWEDEGDE